MSKKTLRTLHNACRHLLDSDGGIYCLTSLDTALAVNLLWQVIEEKRSWGF